MKSLSRLAAEFVVLADQVGRPGKLRHGVVTAVERRIRSGEMIAHQGTLWQPLGSGFEIIHLFGARQ